MLGDIPRGQEMGGQGEAVMSFSLSCIVPLDGSSPASSHPRKQEIAVPAQCHQVSGVTLGLHSSMPG